MTDVLKNPVVIVGNMQGDKVTGRKTADVFNGGWSS